MNIALKLILLTMALIPQIIAQTNSSVDIYFLDVRGDSVLIDMGEKEIIIDGGKDKDILYDFVKKTGIIDGKIELVILTHGDSDHWQGLEKLLLGKSSYEILEFWDPGFDSDKTHSTTQKYQEFIANLKTKLNKEGAKFCRPLENFHSPATQTGYVVPFYLNTLSGIKFSLLHTTKMPSTKQKKQGGFGDERAYKINNTSIVLSLEILGKKVLLTGDANGKFKPGEEPSGHTPGAPIDIEKMLLDLYTKHYNNTGKNILKADILKVPHHGSETASTKKFIDIVRPHYMVISANKILGFGLPKKSVVERYENYIKEFGQGQIFRTDRNSKKDTDHIRCSIVNGELQVSYIKN